MVIDISKFTGQSYSSIIMLAVLGLILLICIFSCTGKGIIKDLFNLVYLIGLVVMFVFAMPPAMAFLRGFGFIENLQASSTGIVKTIMDKLPADTVYLVLVIIALLIVYLIVVKILNAIFHGAFKTKGKRLVKFFGFIYSFLFFFIISTVILEVVSSPLILKGGHQLVNDSQYVALYKTKVTDPLQEVLYEQGVISNVDDILIAKDTSLDSFSAKQAAHDSFAQVDLFLYDRDAYVASLKTNSAFDDEKVVEAANNMCYFVKVAKLSDGFLNKKMITYMKSEIVNWIACFESSEGVPVKTFSVGSEGSTLLANMSSQLELSDAIKDRINAVFVA